MKNRTTAFALTAAFIAIGAAGADRPPPMAESPAEVGRAPLEGIGIPGGDRQEPLHPAQFTGLIKTANSCEVHYLPVAELPRANSRIRHAMRDEGALL